METEKGTNINRKTVIDSQSSLCHHCLNIFTINLQCMLEVFQGSVIISCLKMFHSLGSAKKQTILRPLN